MMVDLQTFGLSEDFDLAGRAIEQMVHQFHPSYDQHRWGSIKPMADVSGWGLELPTWTMQLGVAVTAFRGLVAPRKLTLSPTEVRNSGGLPLRNLQLYLAQKVQHALR